MITNEDVKKVAFLSKLNFESNDKLEEIVSKKLEELKNKQNIDLDEDEKQVTLVCLSKCFLHFCK